MCPIVPTFTCGFDRSNFSFAISLPSLQRLTAQTRLADALSQTAANIETSVVGVNLQVLRPQLGSDMLHRCEIQLANLAAIEIAQPFVGCSRFLAQKALRQHGFEVTHAQALCFDALEESVRRRRRERSLNRGTHDIVRGTVL